MESFEGKRVTVMGLGRFGGGVGVTRWLCGQGAKVLVTDLLDADALKEPLAEIDDLVKSGAVELRLGEHREDDFRGADVVIANPAVPTPWKNPYLRAAEDAGVPITTEIRLTVERLPNREHVIGVTGTAGKSTTAAMIAHVLRKCGETVHLGGNIGVSLLSMLDEIKETDWVVLELSSAQLYWLGQGIGSVEHEGWSPKCAVLTNFSPNHLDWHGTVEDYRAAKGNIFAYQSEGDRAIFLDQQTREMFDQCQAYEVYAGGHIEEITRRVWPDISTPRSWKSWLGRFFSRTVQAVDPRSKNLYGLGLPGRHNRQNANLATVSVESVCESFTGEMLDILDVVPLYNSVDRRLFYEFYGLPHRLQFAGEFGGVRVFNDSKCTTPQACALAVGAFDEEGECGADHVHLICGGYDKGVDLSPMVEAAAKCAGVYTIGTVGQRLAEAVNEATPGKTVFCETLDRAVEAAAKRVGEGDGGGVLLLSPGCASWDQFTNYEERGERFIELAKVALSGHRNR